MAKLPNCLFVLICWCAWCSVVSITIIAIRGIITIIAYGTFVLHVGAGWHSEGQAAINRKQWSIDKPQPDTDTSKFPTPHQLSHFSLGKALLQDKLGARPGAQGQSNTL